MIERMTEEEKQEHVRSLIKKYGYDLADIVSKDMQKVSIQLLEKDFGYQDCQVLKEDYGEYYWKDSSLWAFVKKGDKILVIKRNGEKAIDVEFDKYLGRGSLDPFERAGQELKVSFKGMTIFINFSGEMRDTSGKLWSPNQEVSNSAFDMMIGAGYYSHSFSVHDQAVSNLSGQVNYKGEIFIVDYHEGSRGMGGMDEGSESYVQVTRIRK